MFQVGQKVFVCKKIHYKLYGCEPSPAWLCYYSEIIAVYPEKNSVDVRNVVTWMMGYGINCNCLFQK